MESVIRWILGKAGTNVLGDTYVEGLATDGTDNYENKGVEQKSDNLFELISGLLIFSFLYIFNIE